MTFDYINKMVCPFLIGHNNYDVYVNDDCNAGGWGCGHMMCISIMSAMQEGGAHKLH